MPKLHINDDLYNGRITDFSNLICFSPLYKKKEGEYNTNREMSDIMCNNLINILYSKYKNNFIVITDRPDKITNKHVRRVVDSNLYNIIYVISKCKVFIGGDTGFTHFAGLCRPRGIVSIYEDNQFRNFNSKLRIKSIYSSY